LTLSGLLKGDDNRRVSFSVSSCVVSIIPNLNQAHSVTLKNWKQSVHIDPSK